jgi:formylglycine-generating enzyme required for sulfatase activity
MKRLPRQILAAATAVMVVLSPAALSLTQDNERLLQRLREVHGLHDAQVQQLRGIFARSGFIGQGNPAISHHPMTPAQCQAARDAAARRDDDEAQARTQSRICRGPHMAPLYDPATQSIDQARACIDQYEFPDIPCEYPVVWTRASEAAQICQAMGKRLCDAHEWEGACQGQLLAPDYRFDLARGTDASTAVARMRQAHNRTAVATARWSYGAQAQPGVCATGSQKTPGCAGGGWLACGSNTYPSGAFPACRSPLGVYDLNGNVAEHMNLPLAESQMASRGSSELGVTEMKGSWFIFDSYHAHEDWCRWRAPYWHGSRVLDRRSHANYHLGFRCCKTLSSP